MSKKTKQKILDALEDKETKEYLVSFGDVFVEAESVEEAERKAEKLIQERDIEINSIEEN